MAATIRGMADATAALLAESLDFEVSVEAISIVHGGRLRRGGVTGESVTLLRAYQIIGWIRGRQSPYSHEELEALSSAARMLPISHQALIVR